MDFTRTRIPDVIIIQPKVFEDDRGFFMETYQESIYCELGIGPKFAQDSHSGSKQGVLRGLHYQIQHPQGKLVRVIAGEIFDAAVDIRKSSATFGQWVGVVLSAKNKHQLWLPPGFAHGFLVLSDWAEIVYKSTEPYDPQGERCIIWNDPLINIKWPIDPQIPLLISAKDQQGALFEKAEVFE